MRFQRPKRPDQSEDGFTLIEVLIAAFILVAGSMAIFMTFAAALHNVQRGRDAQVAQGVAQREVEKIHALPYSRVVMTSLPTASTETTSPAKRISGSEFTLSRTGTEKAPLAIAGTGVCTSSAPCVNSSGASSCVGGTSPGTFVDGTAKGSVYCYVTSAKDESCESATGTTCPYKRIVVAVWLEKDGNQGARPSYYELQSTVYP
jgi:prepilin-type N-terminal cleavage/methylation domain-containing protein